ncbi:TerD family protein [Streptomyces sp. J2-1]|uniref:TerD family protein n=1 Tax=Streptomyces corallincola TaxID=2851888 RepID=UPI001C3930EF|nr:TerD family protein [Streptomyces corallincola]MBV2357709.1 TerD family protein [Streptomyces corallincola]
MTVELVRGQNHPLSRARLEIRISAGVPVLAGAVLGDKHGTVPDTAWVAHPGATTLPGIEVSGQAAADHRLAVDLDALPAAAHRVTLLLALPALPGRPHRFGAVPAPHTAVTALDGTEIASYTLTGLDAESAVVALELYRRDSGWKVRAVGQGYADGLPALLADQGLGTPDELAARIEESVARGLARAVPGPRPRDTSERQPAGASASVGGAVPVPDAVPGPVPVPPADSPLDPVAAADAVPPGGGRVDYTHPGRRPRTTMPEPAPEPVPASASATPGSAASHTPPPEDGPARPVAGDAAGWTLEERLYNQVWGMFEDLARTAAARRSAVEFADTRLDRELDAALADPRARLGTAGEAAREAALTRHAELVEQADAAFDRDVEQIAAESAVVEPALSAPCARWDHPVWHGYRVPEEPAQAVRLGELHLPESPDLRIPLLVRLPLERGLWIDSAPGPDGPDGPDGPADTGDTARRALETAVALAVRLLAAHPAGEFAVHAVDPDGAGARALRPLTDAGLLPGAARGATGVAEILGRLTHRVDLVQMAVRGGAAGSLPPDLDTGRHLLIVNDFPHGFDDRAVTQLRYLADEGPAVGVHLLLVADRAGAAAYGPLLDPLWRSLMRLTPVPDDHLADPWVGHAWTYEPSLVPPGSAVLRQVLTALTDASAKDK